MKAHQTIMLGECLVTEKQSHFSNQREESQKTDIEKNLSLTFDDLHQMTLIGLHVTQYMYVLFDEVNISIQKSEFTLARYV